MSEDATKTVQDNTTAVEEQTAVKEGSGLDESIVGISLKTPEERAKLEEKTSEPPAGTTEEPPAGPPEQYEDFSLPEGAHLAGDTMERFKALAKECGLTQEQAQKQIELNWEGFKETLSRFNDHLTEQVENVRIANRKALKADPDIGGQKLEETTQRLGRVINKYFPGIGQKLHDAVLTDDVDFVKGCVAIDKDLGEDVSIGGAPPPPKSKSAAEKMFPKSAEALESAPKPIGGT